MSKLKVHTDFDFGELIQNLCTAQYINFHHVDQDTLKAFLGTLNGAETDLPDIYPNVFKFSGDDVLYKDYILDLLQGLYNRYKHQAFVGIDIPFTPWDRQIPAITDTNVQKEFGERLCLLINKINDTAPKYSKLLSLYSSNESKLMDKLSNKVSAGAKVEGLSRFNDTPQDGGLYDDDSHTTNLTATSSSSKSNSTTTYDDKNIMARLEEVRALYRNLMKEWNEEFEEFFWEVDGHEN